MPAVDAASGGPSSSRVATSNSCVRPSLVGDSEHGAVVAELDGGRGSVGQAHRGLLGAGHGIDEHHAAVLARDRERSVARERDRGDEARLIGVQRSANGLAVVHVHTCTAPSEEIAAEQLAIGAHRDAPDRRT